MADSTPPIPPKPSPVPGPVPTRGDESNGRLGPLPAELRNVSVAMRITGEVVQSNRDGTVRVHTDRGDIDIKLNRDQPVPERGQKVEVEIQAGQPPERASIRPVREQPPEQVPPRTTQTPVDVEVGVKPQTDVKIQPPPTPPTEQPPKPMPEVGQIVRIQPVTVREIAALLTTAAPEVILSVITQVADFKAQVIAAQVGDAMAAQTLSIKAEAAQIVTNITTGVQSQTPDVTLPPFAASGAETTKTPLPGAALPPASQAASLEPLVPFLQPLAPPELMSVLTQVLQPSLTTGLSPTLPPLTQPLDVRVEAIIEPKTVLALPEDALEQPAPNIRAGDPAAILQDNKPGLLSGIVTGATPESLPILSMFLPGSSTLQNFIMQVPVDAVIPGTQIQLMPQPTSAQAAQLIESGLLPALGMIAPGSWPVMSEVFQALTQVSPQLAQAFSAMTPSPANPAQMNPAALFFIAAVRGGDMAGWLGEKAVDALRRDGRGGLLARLTQEGGLLNRMAAEPLSNDWRGMNLPMLWQNDMHKVALYYKHDRNAEDKDGQKIQKTRFIFDLKLTQMGKVQLDGLFRGGRLDLIVRTEDVFSQPMQMEMRRTYATALKGAELAGELSFQNKPEQWVTINPDAKSRMGVSA